MRKLATLLCIIGLSTTQAQQVEHIINGEPINVLANSLTLSATHGFAYQLNKGLNGFEVNVLGTIIRQLDSKLSERLEIKELKKFLTTSAVYRLNIFNAKNEEYNNRLTFYCGQEYTQHNNRLNTDYWYINRLTDNTYNILQSRNTHSVKVGIEGSLQRFKMNRYNGIYPQYMLTMKAEYMYTFAYSLTGINAFEFYKSVSERPIIIDKNYTFNPHGLRTSFQYKHFVHPKIGVYGEMEGMYFSDIDYKPNPNIFVPRGGEHYIPLYLAFKIGVGFHLK